MPRYIGRNLDGTINKQSGDPHFSNVSLLIQPTADAVASDIGVTGHTVTEVGNANVTAAESRFDGYSIVFDGTGDYLDCPAHANFNLGTGDFTIEGWVKTTTAALVGSYSIRLFQIDGPTSFNTAGNFQVFLNSSTGALRLYEASLDSSGSTALTDNSWHHWAVSRVGTALKGFVDGVQEISITSSLNITANSTTPRPRIGAHSSSQGTFTGYMDAIRVTIGVGRYTGNFSVPSSAYPYTGHQGHLDNKYNSGIWSISESSGDGYSIINRIQNDKWKNDPFGSSVVLFIQPRADAATIDVAPTGHTVTEVGNANVTAAESKFDGFGIQLDGTGDWLQVPAHANFDFGSGDFTIEMFVMFDATTNYQALAGSDGYYTSGKNGNWVIRTDTGAQNLKFVTYDAQAAEVVTTGTFAFSQSTWYHVAAVRISGTITFYVDGVSKGSGTNDKTLEDGADGGLSFGEGLGGNNDLNGHLDAIRVTKGVGRYTANFTVPDLGGRLYSQL